LEKKIFQYPNINETAFSINLLGLHLNVQWYGLSYIAGILLAWFFMAKLVQNKNLWLSCKGIIERSEVDDLITYMIFGIIIGGRLGYCLFYTPGYYFDNPIKIIFIWEGGMSFHGGFFGVLISGILFGVRKKISLLSLGDLIAFASPPGLFFGRIANFINGELWGKPTTPTFGIQFTKGNGQFCPSPNEIPCFRHPSQLYEAFFEGVVLMTIFYYLVFVSKALKKPGLIFGSFLLGYGVIRFSVEFLREPDAFFITNENPYGYVVEFFPGIGMSMGQLLTVPMFVFGLLMIILVSKRNLDAN
jgi:phosphatidylglycerol:prolipoprotein diacylglycerol transferase